MPYTLPQKGASVTSDPQQRMLDLYMQTYGLTAADLVEEEGLSETAVINAATADYQRDRLDVFEIEPQRCALIVIDMQLGFVSRSSPQWVPQAERMTPRLAEFAAAARRMDVPVLFTSANFLDPSPTDALKMTTAIADGNLSEASHSLDIVPDLWRDGDILIGTKHTYDAFANTDLDYRLRALRRDTTIITGTLTNFCCDATARAAFDRGYHVLFCSDLCASDNALAHQSTVQTIRRGYGRVMDSGAIVAALNSQ